MLSKVSGFFQGSQHTMSSNHKKLGLKNSSQWKEEAACQICVQGPEHIHSSLPQGFAARTQGQPGDSAGEGCSIPSSDQGRRLPDSAVGQPQQGLTTPVSMGFAFKLRLCHSALLELQLPLCRSHACAWPWALLIQTPSRSWTTDSLPALALALSHHYRPAWWSLDCIWYWYRSNVSGPACPWPQLPHSQLDLRPASVDPGCHPAACPAHLSGVPWDRALALPADPPLGSQHPAP